ncbi:hypothetical protein K1I43_12340 [Anoxybacillus sp. ST70]|uniref:B3/B4 domain-containing protein n=1 Tax=unclassified Anoxybacillus TaxID=2639704 RepID=UPI001969C3DD|nr:MULTISPECIES: phenylalanine--tRNA ligase beta subunit-related protein [unclassified Anoxybacillus]MBW9219321.1 hypothetical protein [Anoxybacillus sp. ST70]
MLTICDNIKQHVSHFKIGVLTYEHIVVGPSPSMLKGKLRQFQELLYFDMEQTPLAEWPEVKEWRSVFKQIGTDPSRYRPSSESLLRRVQRQTFIPSIHSAADVNNFFSLYYKLPIGIYDRDHLIGDIVITIGTQADEYIGINDRTTNFERKLVSKDAKGAFGSPIVDSKRTMVTEQTTHAIQIVYFLPSFTETQCEQMLQAMKEMFIQIHGGTAHAQLVK